MRTLLVLGLIAALGVAAADAAEPAKTPQIDPAGGGYNQFWPVLMPPKSTVRSVPRERD
jgi:hypothetical protein